MGTLSCGTLSFFKQIVVPPQHSPRHRGASPRVQPSALPAIFPGPGADDSGGEGGRAELSGGASGVAQGGEVEDGFGRIRNERNAQAEGDSGDEEFVDAEADYAPPVRVAEPVPQVAAFHPPPGLAIGNKTFSLPGTIRQGTSSYNLRSRPEGPTD